MNRAFELSKRLIISYPSRILKGSLLHKKYFFPQMQNSNQVMSSNQRPIPVEELKIPFPYGDIAAKVWGQKGGIPILAIHGWQDNAGTFDNLIPLLSPDFYIVAIDVVGHGLSYHKPPGSYYHFMEKLIDVKLIVDFLKWERFSLIGHSLGGALSLMFASVYPDSVDKLILLDVLKPQSKSIQKLPHATKRNIEKYLTLVNKLKNSIPVYAEDEAVKRLINAVQGQLTENSAKVLLKRGSQPSKCGNGVIFTRDIRIQAAEILVLEDNVFEEYMTNLKCELLVIKAKGSPNYNVKSDYYKQKLMTLFEKNCKRFKYVEVEGNHYVHLNNPERVAPYINEFFNSLIVEKCKL